MRLFHFWSRSGEDDYQSVIYLIFSPYNFLLIFVFSAFYKVKQIKFWLLNILMLVFFCLTISGIRYFEFPQFPMNFIKCSQYFWGAIIPLVAAYIIGKKAIKKQDIDLKNTIQKLLSISLLTAAAITIIEFIAFNIMGFPIDNFYFNNLNVSDNYTPEAIIHLRPFGITSYPQANGLILSILVFLNYLYLNKFNIYCYLGTVAVLLTLTGSGMGCFIFLLPLLFKRTWIGFVIVLIGTLLFMQFVFIYIEYIYSKLSYDYLLFLFNLSLSQSLVIFQDFDLLQYLIGSSSPSFNTGGTKTSDWAYIAVFYELGLLGLVVYLALYSYVLFWALPANVRTSKRIYFVFTVMILNFHYPVLNYYVAQFLVSIVAGLNLATHSFRVSPFGSQKIGQKYQPELVSCPRQAPFTWMRLWAATRHP